MDKKSLSLNPPHARCLFPILTFKAKRRTNVFFQFVHKAEKSSVFLRLRASVRAWHEEGLEIRASVF